MSVRYRKLNQNSENSESEEEVEKVSLGSQDEEDFSNDQFTKQPERIPWKAILYALLLFLLGTFLLSIGCLVVTGHIENVHYHERFWPLIILGSLMFIPGSYHTYFAYKVFSGDPQWNFSEFPDF